MKRTNCGSCGSGDLEVILDLGSTPLTNEFPRDPGASLKFYPLEMVQCAACKLCQIGEIVDDAELWHGEYAYYSSTSAALRSHFGEYARTVLQRYPTLAHRLTVDVGCNDGLLLQHFAAEGCRAIGIDPAKGPVAAAQAMGLDVRCEQFSAATAENFVAAEGQAGIVVANNVAAHVADLGNFLAGLRVLLAPDGILVMEVQYLPDLLVGNGFDMLYHEHRFYYSLASLRHALALRDLRMVGVEFVATQSGSIRVFVKRSSAPHHRATHQALRLDQALQAEAKLGDGGLVAGLQFRANRIGERLRAELETLKRAGLTIAGYGAPAKATTLLHWTDTAGYLSWVEDTTPFKQGRFMPGHSKPLQVLTPTMWETGGRPDAYLLLAYNYAPSILHNERDYLANGGRIVVPLPAPITLGEPLHA